MARRLVAAGHEVHMITSDQRGLRGPRWRETDEAGIRVHWARVAYDNKMSFVRRVLAFVAFAWAATFRALWLKGDVILATSTPLTIAIPALLASRFGGIPFVFEVRDMWPDVPIAIGALRNPLAIKAARVLELQTYRRAARVVALAPGMRDDIIAKGVPAGKVVVIPNGCDTGLFRGGARADVRSAHPWLGARKLVLYAGAIGRINGLAYLVDLARETMRIDPAVRFAVFGAGAERERVRAFARREGVLGENLFMFDPLPKLDLADWVAAADLALALIRFRAIWKDAVENKFFDAVAAGKPIAMNFNGWQTQIALDAGIGIVLDPASPPAAAGRLVAALRDDAWLRGVPERAASLADGEFSRDRLAARLLAVLEAAAAAGPKARCQESEAL